jgi:hypothetical protein
LKKSVFIFAISRIISLKCLPDILFHQLIYTSSAGIFPIEAFLKTNGIKMKPINALCVDLAGVVCILIAALLFSTVHAENIRLIVETDIGGDPDDQATFVRFLLYVNEWDVEGIITTRPVGDSREPGGGYALAKQYVQAYGDVAGNLSIHDPRYPSESFLMSILKDGSGNDGRDLIIDALDKNDPRPLWYTNWGADDGRTSSLKKALDKIKSERNDSEYQAVMETLKFVEVYKQNHIGNSHRAALGFYMDTFYPDMDGGRWYHRFKPLTETAGGIPR